MWESTGLNLYPGYANWADGEPNNANGGEDCLGTGHVMNGRIGWNDEVCGNFNDAICEAHA
jgi:C-type lectin domain family 10 protein A